MLEKQIALDENSAFNFECRLCGNCCKQMLIRLTPYDIIKLSYGLNLTTYDFIQDYVVFLKTPNVEWHLAALKHAKQGECMFKKGKKCNVHLSRPLPCRLFPVGRGDNAYVLHKTKYCKGHAAGVTFSLEEWLDTSEALPYLTASRLFYEFMEEITAKYNLLELSSKNQKLFYKILYDYDSATLESTIRLEKTNDKVAFCLRMAEWFLNNWGNKEITDKEFLAAYESQAIAEAAKLR